MIQLPSKRRAVFNKVPTFSLATSADASDVDNLSIYSLPAPLPPPVVNDTSRFWTNFTAFGYGTSL